MAVPIERIVQVTVTKTSAAVSRQGFGTPLGVHQVDTLTQASRFRTYTSVQELLDAGFDLNGTAVAWATVIKAQNPAPIQFAIGRRVPGVRKVYTVTITAPEVGGWVLNVADAASGYSMDYGALGDAGSTNESLAEELRSQIEQDEFAIVTVPSGPISIDNFTTTAGLSGVDYILTLTPPGAGMGTTVIDTANTNPEDMATCLAAINDENEKDWFLFNIDSRTDADITDAASFASANRFLKMFVAQTKSDDMRTQTQPNIGDTLGALNYTNVVLMWTQGDLNYLDALMTGIAAAADLDSENGVITWANRQGAGVPASDLPSGDINNITGENGNVYVDIGNRDVVLDGKSVEGEFADVETTLAWTKARVQEAVFAVITTTTTKIPYDDEGIALIQAATLGVLRTGVRNRHFSGDNPDFPRVLVPTAAFVRANLPADFEARVLRNVIGEAKLSGAIHSTIQQVLISV